MKRMFESEQEERGIEGDPVSNTLLDVHRKRRQAWTEEEDNLLIQELTEHGLNWRKIIPLFPHRSHRSVSDHVHVLLDRNQSLKDLNLKRSKSDRRSELKHAAKEQEETAFITATLSAQEDTPLVQKNHVANETGENACIRKTWSAEEDSILIQAVDQHVYNVNGGCDNWDAVAAIIQERFPRRTPRACRHRWLRMIGSGPAGSKLSMHTKWTEQEDDRLIKEQKEHGCRWDYMLDKFPNRTCDTLQCRWTFISKGRYQRAAKNKPPEGIFLTDCSIGEDQFEALGGMDTHGIPTDAFLGDLDIQPTEYSGSSLLSVSLEDDRLAQIDPPGVEDYGIIGPD